MNRYFYNIRGTKEEGTPVEFHEFLCLIWLEYLLKIGFHDNAMPVLNIIPRLKQFRGLVKYDKMMAKGEITTDGKLEKYAPTMNPLNTRSIDNSQDHFIPS